MSPADGERIVNLVSRAEVVGPFAGRPRRPARSRSGRRELDGEAGVPPAHEVRRAGRRDRVGGEVGVEV